MKLIFPPQRRQIKLDDRAVAQAYAELGPYNKALVDDFLLRVDAIPRAHTNARKLTSYNRLYRTRNQDTGANP